VPLRAGPSCHGLLHEPVEELSEMLRKAAVEAEREFVAVRLQMSEFLLFLIIAVCVIVFLYATEKNK
jgi:hypothetical protein